MCRTETLTVPPHPASSGRVRHWAAGYLRDWQVPGDTVDAAVLMLSEAVSNAIVHARTDATVSIALTGDYLEVLVTDLAPGQPSRPRRRTATDPAGPSAGAGPLAESGRGLQMIDTMAEAWGLEDVAAGKQLWFRLWVTRTPQVLAGCRCCTD